jgi:alpha-ketoglutaric semialdehyde dehydrogenase
MAETQHVLIGGQWRPSASAGSFQAINPATGDTLEAVFPVSSSAEIDAVLGAGADASAALLTEPDSKRADFLERYAERLEARKDELVEWAHRETALPASPRLGDVELPRTAGQLRQAAAAVREGSWALPTIDTKNDIRSVFGPLGGPVAVFGPNNFPFAFNGVAGGDFAAAIAAGSPVIAKGHPSHPTTSKLMAEEAREAVRDVGLHEATVQMIYRMAPKDGLRLVSDPRIAASAYTGSRSGGLRLKQAADAAGKPIYLELSSINPVFVLPGALRERLDEVVDELFGSALLGTGQFCTKPGLVVLPPGAEARAFVDRLREKYAAAAPGPLLNAAGVDTLASAVDALRGSGAELVVGGSRAEGAGCRFQNTILRASAAQLLSDPEGLQREAFGNACLLVETSSLDELPAVAAALEGNLTGSVYSDRAGGDDALYDRVAPVLRRRVGRLLNDKMPTGVAVSPAMNHGGPYPATGHPGFTAVGIPASIRRFAMLECYDNVREARLPASLRNENPNGKMWRLVDGSWTTADVG